MRLSRYVCQLAVPPSVDESEVSDRNLSVVVDRPIVINCPIKGVPQPEVAWFKNGVPFRPSDNRDVRILSNGQRLEIGGAELADAGRYKCLAKNAAGQTDLEYELYVWGECTCSSGVSVHARLD